MATVSLWQHQNGIDFALPFAVDLCVGVSVLMRVHLCVLCFAIPVFVQNCRATCEVKAENEATLTSASSHHSWLRSTTNSKLAATLARSVWGQHQLSRQPLNVSTCCTSILTNKVLRDVDAKQNTPRCPGRFDLEAWGRRNHQTSTYWPLRAENQGTIIRVLLIARESSFTDCSSISSGSVKARAMASQPGLLVHMGLVRWIKREKSSGKWPKVRKQRVRKLIELIQENTRVKSKTIWKHECCHNMLEATGYTLHSVFRHGILNSQCGRKAWEKPVIFRHMIVAPRTCVAPFNFHPLGIHLSTTKDTPPSIFVLLLPGHLWLWHPSVFILFEQHVPHSMYGPKPFQQWTIKSQPWWRATNPRTHTRTSGTSGIQTKTKSPGRETLHDKDPYNANLPQPPNLPWTRTESRRPRT